MRNLLKRRWLWATLLLAVVVGAGYALVPAREPLISQATCDKLQYVWSVERVEVLLGKSPYLHFDKVGWGFAGWFDEDGNAITIDFDRERGVTGKRFTPTNLSVLGRAKRRIEWRVHGK